MSNMFDKYNIPIPKRNLDTFEKDDMEKIITFHIGKRIPRVLKELDIYIDKKKHFNAKQTSLIYNGKNDKRENYRMPQYVKTYLDFYNDMEISIFLILSDILEEMMKDMNNYNKDYKRKEKFFNTLESIEGQSMLFTIGIISIGEQLIKNGKRIPNGTYLENVLIARQLLAKEIQEVFKAMNKDEISRESANLQFRTMIQNKVQKLIVMDSSMYQAVKDEEDLHSICNEDSIQDFIYEIVESARIKATNKIRLLDL